MARQKDGWVKISRKLIDDEIWTSEPFTKGQAWVDLILLAQWETNGQYKAGSVYRSLNYLASRWKWSRRKVTRYLEVLENAEKITFFRGQSFESKKAPVNAPVNAPTKAPVDETVISLKNWQKYQYTQAPKAPADAPIKEPVNAHNKRIYKEDKRINANAETANGSAAVWKTTDERVPEEYRADFASYEEYYNWRNQ